MITAGVGSEVKSWQSVRIDGSQKTTESGPSWSSWGLTRSKTMRRSTRRHLLTSSEMEKVGSGGHLNIFAQVHGSRCTAALSHRHRPRRGRTERPADPAGGRALAHFIESSLMKVKHRRKDHSMLVLWGHAYDFALGRAPTRRGSIDALDFAELRGVLLSLQDKMLEHMEARSVRRSTSSASMRAISRA